jgi:hypothetical protein
MAKILTKVTCPVCGFGHSVSRILGKFGVDRPLWPVEVIFRWVTSGGRGKIQTHWAELPPGEGEKIRLRVLSAMLARLRWAVQVLEEALEEPGVVLLSPSRLTSTTTGTSASGVPASPSEFPRVVVPSRLISRSVMRT